MKTSEKHTFISSRYRPRHLSFKLTHTNSCCTDTHTNVHLLNMCPADVVAMKKALFCIYEGERERGGESEGNMERQEIPEECKYMRRRKKGN